MASSGDIGRIVEDFSLHAAFPARTEYVFARVFPIMPPSLKRSVEGVARTFAVR
jgi:hypothetical protein